MNISILRILLLTAISLPLYGQFWQTDFDEARKLASSANKTLVVVFQGSDWCAPCIKLDKQIWSDPKFEAYAKDHFIMVKVDFPRRKKNALSKEQSQANAQLADKYNPQGIFPLVVLLDTDENVLGTTGYRKASPEEYIQILESFKS